MKARGVQVEAGGLAALGTVEAALVEVGWVACEAQVEEELDRAARKG